jgi:hypothetical protein
MSTKESEEKVFVYLVGGKEFPTFEKACEESKLKWKYTNVVKTLAAEQITPKLAKCIKKRGTLIFDEYRYSRLYDTWFSLF